MPTNHKRSDTAIPFPGFDGPNYTQVPDILFDELMVTLSGAELKVLLYIMRRTFGFKREADNIALSQLLNGIVTKEGKRLDWGAGLSKPTLLTALDQLEQRGIILRQRRDSIAKGHEPTSYRLRMRGDGAGELRHDPLVKKFDQGVGQKTLPSPWSKNLTIQETVVQETVEDSSNSSASPQSNPQGLAPSKFRKATSPVGEEGRALSDDSPGPIDPSKRPTAARVSAVADTATDRGMAHIRDVLAKASIAPRPAPDGDHTQADPRGREPLAGRPRRRTRTQPVNESEAAGIRAYLGDYAPELGDKAPFKSSMTRVTNLYVESGLTVAAFTTRMDSARRRTKATPNLRNKFSYFLALLEEECGLREPPPERADAARQRGMAAPVEEESDAVPAERQSLAGRYRHLVKR